MSEQSLLEGFISVQAAVQGGNRTVQAIYVREDKRQDRRMRRLWREAEAANIPVQLVAADVIDARTQGRSHGGIVAEVGPRRFVTMAALLKGGKRPLVVMLDGIEDPFNYGQAIRALYATGVQGVVVRPRNWSTAAGVVARASAGASERMVMAVAETALTAAAFYRERGLTIACTAKETAVSLYEADLTQPLFLLIGGEKRGITRSFLNQADLRIKIPYQRTFAYSLGAAASAAIIGAEMMRQRHYV